MDREKIMELLDKSCADALDAWHQGKEIDRPRAFEAMTALEDRLGSLKIPNYHCEYVPPAYVVSYQLSHINLAWSAFSQIESRLKEKRGVGIGHQDLLNIIDFGAGASSGRIGAALFLAEAIRNGCSPSLIYFDEIDTSTLMLEMGELVWQAFTRLVQRGDFADEYLSRAVKSIEPRKHMDGKTVKGHDCETWLIAFHVMYQDQYNYVLEREFDLLDRRVKLLAGAFTCHSNLAARMKKVIPFSNYELRYEENTDEKRCKTNHIIGRAIKYGFRRNYWYPYLEVKKYALLVGDTFEIDDIPF